MKAMYNYLQIDTQNSHSQSQLYPSNTDDLYAFTGYTVVS